MKPSLVTAVIPAFNSEKYILAAIDSVLSQTYEQIECLVVDDGSTDSTARLVASRPGVRCISQVNGGVAKARNVGIREARGDLIAFLDADDAWLPDKTETQVRLFESEPRLGLAYSGMWITDEQLEPVGRMHAPPSAVALRNSLLMEPPVVSVAQTAIVPKGVLGELGGFDERMTTSADTDLACRIAIRHLVEGVDEPLVLYRQHESQMHHNTAAMEHDMAALFEKIFTSDADPRVADLERRARANLEVALGLARLHERDFAGTTKHLLAATRLDPWSFPRAVRRRSKVRG